MSIDHSLQHGRDYRGEDLAGWLLSEKLEGVFGCWTGAEMLTRGGKVVAIPHEWASALPRWRVFGEMHAGRGRFQEARVFVRTGRFSPRMRFDIFDAELPGAWEERLGLVRGAVRKCASIGVVGVQVARSTRHALARMNEIIEAGGEGLMARHPGNLWQPGRTHELLKLTNPARAARAAC